MTKRTTTLVWILINTVILIYTLIPVVWIISLSLKPAANIQDGKFFPYHPNLDNYRGIFKNTGFPNALWNSLGISVLTTVLTLIVATMAAYAVVRVEFIGKKLFLLIALLISMFPQISLVTPLFNLENKLGLFDSWLGLIIPYIGLGLPIAIYVLGAFFSQIPWELERAAIMDGAKGWVVFSRILIPLVSPGVITAGIIVFIFSWNDLLLGLSLTATQASITAPVAIAHFSGISQFEEPTGSIAAGAVVITIPIIIIVMIFQRKIVAGLTSGAVKG